MSMILDALTRAEHERQLEKQPDLKFVTPVKPQKNNPNKIWLYVGLGVLANVLIIFFVIRAMSGDAENEMEIAASSVEIDQPSVTTNTTTNIQQQVQPIVKPSLQQETELPAQGLLAQELAQTANIEAPLQQAIQNPIPADDRPLAMEATSMQAPEVDRPLLYESKQPNSNPTVSKPKPDAELANASGSSTKGNVSFSSTELSADDAAPIINKPKVLIDQGNNDNVANTQASSSGVPNVRDLPESSRTSLNQYEVNVHVFDDDPIRRFVLINMDKYKEGDRIANNGPLVEEITPAGVVVDYGSGRALLPPR